MICPCRRLGGKVFTADSTKPPPRWPKVFAVCPASLTREAEASLVAADASFRLVHPSCRVTTHWLDICVKVGGKGWEAGLSAAGRRYGLSACCWH